MHRRHIALYLAKLLAAATLVAMVDVPAWAQTPAVDVSGRYQALADHSIDKTFATGWSTDAAIYITSKWSAVGEIGGSYRSESELDVALTLHTLGGGARWSPWRTSRLAPFAQFLVGVARMSSTATIGAGEIRVAQTKFMVQPAGGVTIAVGKSWGITSQLGYRRIFLDGDQDGDTGFNEITASTGVLFGF